MDGLCIRAEGFPKLYTAKNGCCFRAFQINKSQQRSNKKPNYSNSYITRSKYNSNNNDVFKKSYKWMGVNKTKLYLRVRYYYIFSS